MDVLLTSSSTSIVLNISEKNSFDIIMKVLPVTRISWSNLSRYYKQTIHIQDYCFICKLNVSLSLRLNIIYVYYLQIRCIFGYWFNSCTKTQDILFENKYVHFKYWSSYYLSFKAWFPLGLKKFCYLVNYES